MKQFLLNYMLRTALLLRILLNHFKFKSAMAHSSLQRPLAIYPLSTCWALFIILTVAPCAACTCDSSPKQKSLQSQSQPQSQSITILLCTANVEEFCNIAKCVKGFPTTSKPRDYKSVLEPLRELKQDTDDLVLIGLQEVKQNHTTDIDNYFQGYTGYHHQGGFSNSLVVFDKSSSEIVHEKVTLTNPGTNEDRYANILYFPKIGLKIANTHILGGRFDSLNWKAYPHARTKQMQDILDQRPTIVMGDFNGERPANVAEYLWSNPPTPEDFEYGVHVELEQRGYIPLLSADQMGHTCWANKTVDWIYINKGLAPENQGCEIVDHEVIEAVSQYIGGSPKVGVKDLSDHNFVWERIRVNLPIPISE